MPIERPNIVLIITDHHAFFDHDREGEFTFKSPRFEAFAEQGVRFERAYCVAPLCSPARASMMTGLYPSAHGIRWNTEWPRNDNLADFRAGQLLYSHYLSQAGYRNAYVGKWHCGHERLPIDYGIEGWSLPDYGRIYMSEAYREYAAERGLGDARARIEHNLNRSEWEGQTLVLHDVSPWRFMNGSGILEGPCEAHEEFFVANLAVEKLQALAHQSQPFSLVVSFWGPHQPYYPTEPYASMIEPAAIPEYPSFSDSLEGKPLRHFIHRDLLHGSSRKWPEWTTWQSILARCYGQSLQLDAATGRVLDALDQLGLSENTLVIWCADHGDAVASHGGLWDKGSTFTEEVSRVPMALRWPAGFSGDSQTDRLVSNMDATATMLDAAGACVPDDMHSRSLLPLCSDPAGAAWPDHLICEHNGHGDDILQRIIISGPYKYVAALFDGDELYDLENDPHEMRNIVDEPQVAHVRDELRARLVEHIETSRDPVASRRLLYALKSGM